MINKRTTRERYRLNIIKLLLWSGEFWDTSKIKFNQFTKKKKKKKDLIRRSFSNQNKRNKTIK